MRTSYGSSDPTLQMRNAALYCRLPTYGTPTFMGYSQDGDRRVGLERLEHGSVVPKRGHAYILQFGCV
jgi:hypothetical protein